MILEQKFIGEHLPNIFAEAMTKVVTEFTKKLREFGTGLTDLEVRRAAQSRAAALSTAVPPAQAPRPGASQPGPVGPGNPRQQRDADTLPPWSRTNPLPVIIQPPVPPIVTPEQTTPPPRTPGNPRYDPFNPPPIPARADGTSGEIGKLFEPKDIIAQLHRGERVLNKDENTDLTKLFGMVTGDRSKNKMADPQSEMLKVIDNITSGMKTKAKPDANKGFDAAYADISSGMMNTGPAQQALIDSQGQILKQIDSFKTNAMPTAPNTGALLGTMPSLEIDKEAAEQIGQSFKETMGDEFKSAVTNISKFAEQMQRGGDQGLQQQMVGLLEDIRRSQASTAKASERMAAVASN
jgi:predicted component of type VI protein secretion system